MARVTAYTNEEVFMGVIDPMEYFAVCEKVDIIPKKSNTDENQLQWTFSVEWKGKQVKLFRYTPLSGKGFGFTREVLEALRIEFEEENGALNFDTDDCIDRECIISVTRGEYNGRATNIADKFTRIPDDVFAEAAGNGEKTDTALVQ